MCVPIGDAQQFRSDVARLIRSGIEQPPRAQPRSFAKSLLQIAHKVAILCLRDLFQINGSDRRFIENGAAKSGLARRTIDRFQGDSISGVC